MWATLTAGRAARCCALAEGPSVLQVQVPCRKCPSTALIRGSPRAVTVASESTFMFLHEAGDVPSREGPLIVDDAAQVLGRPGTRPVEELLECVKLCFGLEHVSLSAG